MRFQSLKYPQHTRTLKMSSIGHCLGSFLNQELYLQTACNIYSYNASNIRYQNTTNTITEMKPVEYLQYS